MIAETVALVTALATVASSIKSLWLKIDTQKHKEDGTTTVKK